MKQAKRIYTSVGRLNLLPGDVIELFFLAEKIEIFITRRKGLKNVLRHKNLVARALDLGTGIKQNEQTAHAIVCFIGELMGTSIDFVGMQKSTYRYRVAR